MMWHPANPSSTLSRPIKNDRLSLSLSADTPADDKWAPGQPQPPSLSLSLSMILRILWALEWALEFGEEEKVRMEYENICFTIDQCLYSQK